MALKHASTLVIGVVMAVQSSEVAVTYRHRNFGNRSWKILTFCKSKLFFEGVNKHSSSMKSILQFRFLVINNEFLDKLCMKIQILIGLKV